MGRLLLVCRGWDMLDQGMDGKGKERMEGMGYGGGKRGGLDMVGGGVEEVVGKASLTRRKRIKA